MLLWKSVVASVPFLSQKELIAYAILTVALSGVIYVRGFRTIVDSNIERIVGLPDLSPFWMMSTPRGYGVIALMVSLGLLLRSISIPGIFLAGPYAVMGTCLLAGSLSYVIAFSRLNSRPTSPK